MEECLTFLKNICSKKFIPMNKHSEIYGAFHNKTNFRLFFLSIDDTVNR